jgi:hypothetical protein
MKSLDMAIMMSLIVLVGCPSFSSRESVVATDPEVSTRVAACSGGLSDTQERALIAHLSKEKAEGKVGLQLTDAVESKINELMENFPEADRKAAYEKYVECLGFEKKTGP